MRHVGMLENSRLRSEFVNGRRVNGIRAFAEDGVRAQLVRKKNK